MIFIYQYKYVVIGGDVRQNLVLNNLSSHAPCLSFGVPGSHPLSHSAQTIELAIKNGENVILPIPMHKGGNLNIQSDCAYHVKELMGYLRKGQTVYAGCIPRECRELMEHKGVSYFDYMDEKEISIYNSIATAEGMIAEVISTYPENLHGSHSLILGYGTCAKTLARKLNALDVRVCICARNRTALMEAYSLGMETSPLSKLSDIIGNYSLIFNTIPSKVLTKEILHHVNSRAIIFDIASFPYGIDVEAAKELKIHTEICMSLPAKYAPVSSSDILTKFILNGGSL